MGLLSMKFSKHLRDRNTATSKQVRLRLNLEMGARLELMDTLKLQVRPHGLAATARSANNCSKRVTLAPDGRTLCVELINKRVTLLKSMLLMHHK